MTALAQHNNALVFKSSLLVLDQQFSLHLVNLVNQVQRLKNNFFLDSELTLNWLSHFSLQS